MHKNLFLKITLFFGLIFVVSLIINRIEFSDMTKPFLEGVCFFLISLILLSNQILRSWLIKVPVPHKIIIAVFVFFLCVSQYIRAPQTTFPFVLWNMYSTVPQEKDIILYDIEGVAAGDERVQLKAAHHFPSLRLFYVFENNLKALKAEEASGVTAEEKIVDSKGFVKSMTGRVRSFVGERNPMDAVKRKQQINDLLKTLGQKHNWERPKQRVDIVELIEKRITLSKDFQFARQRQAVWSVPVGK